MNKKIFSPLIFSLFTFLSLEVTAEIEAPSADLKQQMSEDTFTAKAWFSQNKKFEYLQGQGVEYLAIETAWKKCREKSFMLWGVEEKERKLCVWSSSNSLIFNEKRNIKGRELFHSRFEAYVQSIDPISKSVYLKKSKELFAPMQTWFRYGQNPTPFSDVQLLGIQMDALETGVAACKKAGYYWCVIEKLPEIISANVRDVDSNPRSTLQGSAIRKTTAQSFIRGYHLEGL